MLDRSSSFFRRWWPLLASATAVAVIGTMIFVVFTVIEQRDDLREENRRDEAARQVLADIVEAQRQEELGRQRRLAMAVGEVEARIADLFALHDENVAQKLNETLHRIEMLLGRPAGTPPEPVAAKSAPYRRPSFPAPKAAPAPQPASPAPAPAPDPTTPDQKSCAKHPDGPRC